MPIDSPDKGKIEGGASVPRMIHRPIGENYWKLLFSRRMAACVVSHVDTEELRHAVEVEAESLYEAAVLAIRTFRQHHCEPGELSKDRSRDSQFHHSYCNPKENPFLVTGRGKES